MTYFHHFSMFINIYCFPNVKLNKVHSTQFWETKDPIFIKFEQVETEHSSRTPSNI